MDFLYLVPVALLLGAVGLGVFLWSLRSGQYDDLDGASERILFDDDAPLGPDNSRNAPVIADTQESARRRQTSPARE